MISALVASSPTEPLAGNPTSLMAQMVGQDFSVAFGGPPASDPTGDEPGTSMSTLHGGEVGLGLAYSHFTSGGIPVDSITVPLVTGCEMSIPDTSDPCNGYRQLLRTQVDNYVDHQPGIRTVDMIGHAAADIEPHVGQAARQVGGDGGYWAGLSSDPNPDAIAHALWTDVQTRQNAPLESMAGEFKVLTDCRRAAAKEARAEGADGRLPRSVADNRLEVGRLKYETDLSIVNKGAVAVDIWRARINEAADRLTDASRGRGIDAATNQAITEARALIRRQDDFLAAVRQGREDETTFAH